MFKDLKDLKKETKTQLICEILMAQIFINVLLREIDRLNEKI